MARARDINSETGRSAVRNALYCVNLHYFSTKYLANIVWIIILFILYKQIKSHFIVKLANSAEVSFEPKPDVTRTWVANNTQ